MPNRDKCYAFDRCFACFADYFYGHHAAETDGFQGKIPQRTAKRSTS